MSEDPALRSQIVTCGLTRGEEVIATPSIFEWEGKEARWRFDQDFGSVMPYDDPAAIACATDKVLKGYYNYLLAVWWSQGNVYNAGLPGTCPVDPAPGPRENGPSRAGQEVLHSDGGVFLGELVYKIYTCSFGFQVNPYLTTPDVGGDSQGYYWTDDWDPQNAPPYNDDPYLYGFTTTGNETLLGGTLTLPPFGAVGSPPNLAIYAGTLGDTGGGFPGDAGPLLWTGDPSSGAVINLSSAQVAAGVSLSGFAAVFNITAIDTDTAAGSLPVPAGQGYRLDYWYPTGNATLALDFISPEFCVAQMPSVPPVAPRPTCQPTFATPTLENEET